MLPECASDNLKGRITKNITSETIVLSFLSKHSLFNLVTKKLLFLF